MKSFVPPITALIPLALAAIIALLVAALLVRRPLPRPHPDAESTAPPVDTPQVWNTPALTWESIPPGPLVEFRSEEDLARLLGAV